MEHFNESGDYSDLSLFYPIRNSKIKFYQNGYVSKKTLLFTKKKRAELFDIDVYGNLLYKNDTNLYFWDHEFDLVFSAKKWTVSSATTKIGKILLEKLFVTLMLSKVQILSKKFHGTNSFSSNSVKTIELKNVFGYANSEEAIP